jgi:hypothetical protein
VKPKYVIFATLLATTPFALSPAPSQTVSPITFTRGASSAAVNGAIKGYQFIDYRIAVRAGQQMYVSLRPTRGSPYFNIVEPGSKDVAVYNSSMGTQTFSGTTAKSGAYTIRVYQMRASARRGEVASYRLDVAVDGGRLGAGHANAPAHHPGDALVPGTPYHATSLVRCRTVLNGAFGMCKAGVIRRPGSATLHLDTPDGGERTILFRDGRAVSSDSSEPFRVERRDDTSIIQIGAVEIYEVPDALPFGG